VEVQITPLRDGGVGPITHRVLSQRDVTAQDRGACHFPEASRLSAERVVSTGQVAAGAAYELETPISLTARARLARPKRRASVGSERRGRSFSLRFARSARIDRAAPAAPARKAA
jgi:hypothetical protein